MNILDRAAGSLLKSDISGLARMLPQARGRSLPTFPQSIADLNNNDPNTWEELSSPIARAHGTENEPSLQRPSPLSIIGYCVISCM